MAGQLALQRLAPGLHLLRHLRRMRELYQARQAALIAQLARVTQGTVQLPPCEHGMHLVLPAADGADESAGAAAGAFVPPVAAGGGRGPVSARSADRQLTRAPRTAQTPRLRGDAAESYAPFCWTASAQVHHPLRVRLQQSQ